MHEPTASDAPNLRKQAAPERQLETGIEAACADAVPTMACNMMDESALEGVQAFIEKRPAAWSAR